MKIMTWNINSVRLRENIVLRVMEEQDPDIVCLQETKCPDEHFPKENFEKLGYSHIHINGMKSYNGLCILSKAPFEKTEIHNRVGKEDCRHISARINIASYRDLIAVSSSNKQKDPAVKPRNDGNAPDYFDLHNLYIPAGGDEPDPDINDKYAHKLDFVDEMTRWFADQYSNDNPVVTLGDFNIAPLEQDVWSSKQLQKVVSHTPPERERLDKMLNSIGWVDAVRHFVPEDEKCYSWWSYRNRDWKKSNRGRRLDHIWVTEPLKPALKSHHIHIEARDWEKPSDHVPVMIELDL